MSGRKRLAERLTLLREVGCGLRRPAAVGELGGQRGDRPLELCLASLCLLELRAGGRKLRRDLLGGGHVAERAALPGKLLGAVSVRPGGLAMLGELAHVVVKV